MFAFGNWLPGEPYDERPRHFFSQKEPCRHIFYLKDDDRIRWSLHNIKQFGCRSYRYLKHIGAIVGDFPQERWAKQFARRHPGFIISEPDIEIKIDEPLKGKVAQTLKQIPWGIERINAPQAWRHSMGKGVKVAVIDTGVAYDHAAIERNYRGGVNILSPLFSPYDYNGHGTHVAGTIAGRKNASGVIGVAPRAHLYAVKAFNRKGTANLSDLLTAINWCIDNRMQVINMSFGMDKMSESLKYAIQKARSRGIVMVAAAGNQGTKGKLDFPARYPETIAVTATGKNNQLAAFSNIGREVSLAAPGDKVVSAWNNGSTRELSGTSMAVPHVAGTAALLLALHPELTPADVDAIMQGGSRPITGISSRKMGMIDAYSSVKAVSG